MKNVQMFFRFCRLNTLRIAVVKVIFIYDKLFGGQNLCVKNTQFLIGLIIKKRCMVNVTSIVDVS